MTSAGSRAFASRGDDCVVLKSVFSKEIVHMMSTDPLFFISLAVGIALAGLEVFATRIVDSPMATHFTMFTPAALWLMLLIGILGAYGKRGLWLFAAAPFALFFPLIWAWLYFVCECSIFQEG